ncbi:MAG: KipI family sensor histidine kinase inhibitor [Bacteroidia bacterium]|jgi:KipI family sensor histidine kinase inhibitor
MNTATLRLRVAGENSLTIYLGDTSDPVINARIQAAVAALQAALSEEIIDLVPSYASILVIYRPFGPGYGEIARRIRDALQSLQAHSTTANRCITLPVYYATESGADLQALASAAELSIDEVIALHSATVYRVYAIGFAPGFAYLGDVDPRIRAPRLATPRRAVPKGAVAIADQQTAVYPAQSPGGWNIVGRCPTALFDPTSTPPMPFAVGDQVQFEPISRAHYLSLGGELESALE